MAEPFSTLEVHEKIAGLLEEGAELLVKTAELSIPEETGPCIDLAALRKEAGL